MGAVSSPSGQSSLLLFHCMMLKMKTLWSFRMYRTTCTTQHHITNHFNFQLHVSRYSTRNYLSSSLIWTSWRPNFSSSSAWSAAICPSCSDIKLFWMLAAMAHFWCNCSTSCINFWIWNRRQELHYVHHTIVTLLEHSML